MTFIMFIFPPFQFYLISPLSLFSCYLVQTVCFTMLITRIFCDFHIWPWVDSIYSQTFLPITLVEWNMQYQCKQKMILSCLYFLLISTSTSFPPAPFAHFLLHKELFDPISSPEFTTIICFYYSYCSTECFELKSWDQINLLHEICYISLFFKL